MIESARRRVLLDVAINRRQHRKRHAATLEDFLPFLEGVNLFLEDESPSCGVCACPFDELIVWEPLDDPRFKLSDIRCVMVSTSWHRLPPLPIIGVRYVRGAAPIPLLCSALLCSALLCCVSLSLSRCSRTRTVKQSTVKQ